MSAEDAIPVSPVWAIVPLAQFPDDEGDHAVKQLMRLINLYRPRHARGKRIGVFGALGVIASVVSVAVFALGGAASADSYHSVHFSASTDAWAGWGTGGPGSDIVLKVGASSATYAQAQLTSASGKALPSTSPSFNTTNYAAGSPRLYITLSNGHSLWGYPANSGLNGGEMAWSTDNGNTYEPWSTITAQEAGTTVSRVYVIADGDQAPTTTDMITCLLFNSYTYASC